jgi:hypothetical protein
MQTIDKYILNNSGKDGFISFWWYTWRHLYLDLLFSVRYRSIEIIWLPEFISSLLYTIASSQSILVCVAMWQGDEFIVFILDVYSNVLSARFKNKRGMLCMHVLIIGLNKIPIAISNSLWIVFTTFVQGLFISLRYVHC